MGFLQLHTTGVSSVDLKCDIVCGRDGQRAAH
jgi:hypothetical protein